MTLMARLYLLVVLAVAPAIALLVFNDRSDHQRREREAEADAQRYARLISGEMDRLFEGARTQLATIAAAPTIQNFGDTECGAFLQRLEGQNPATTSFSVYDLNAQQRCTSASPVNIADRPYFRQALDSGSFVVGEYTIGRTSKVPVLPFAMPIRREGQITGVAVTTLRLEWLREYLGNKSQDFPPRSSITVIDKAGTILVRYPNREREGTKLSRYPQLLTSERGGTLQSTAENTNDGVARLLGFTTVNELPVGIGVAVGIPLDTIFAGMAEARIRNLLLLGLTALLALGAAHVGGRAFIQQPVSRLLAAAERWRRGDLAARVPVRDPNSELGQLGSAYNAMAGELERSLQYKDTLLRELSHRVMNSLQTIASLFTLQSRAVKDADARAQFDQAVLRINSVALAYRRLHAAQGAEVVDFSTFLRELCADLQTSMLPQSAPIVVDADPILLSPEQAMPLALVVNELVTNAIKHGGVDPAITVKLGRSSEGCRLAVRNRGELPPGYDPSTTRGFGMRMVRSTMAQLQGRLEAASMGSETEFAVTFEPTVTQPTLRVVEGGRAETVP
ncbi:MAG TPA: cache domain-containing protein [Microvirga sp.]|jgi:two-component sensor histidine kinase|nr:cache domain-containing protein [Microvirga sp.]